MTAKLASSTAKRIAEFPPPERDRLISTRRDLHRHPELAFAETRTASLVADRLRGIGLSPRSGVGRTGVTADPGPPPEPRRILLRADMDGLPLTEATGAAYASEEPGRMHACGHDGHVAIALAVVERLARAPEGGRFRFLFQPAEEGAGGAEACAEDGVLEGVTAALGLHLWNQLPLGKVGVNRGALMAAVDEFSIHVEGPGGHGPAPHETADTVVAAARIVESLQSVVAREISPLEPAVVTVATIHGGDAFNVIPSSVRMTGTARSFSEATGKVLPERIARIVSGTAAAAGVAARLDYRRVNRATVNDRGVAEIVIREAVRLLGEENVETDTRTLGGEDMSVYLSRVPGCFFFVGSAPEGAHRPHHSPVFDIDERALLLGTLLFEAAALAAAREL
jgi:amidohydrolase